MSFSPSQHLRDMARVGAGVISIGNAQAIAGGAPQWLCAERGSACRSIKPAMCDAAPMEHTANREVHGRQLRRSCLR